VRATVAAVLIFGILGISHLAVNHVFAAGLGVDKLVSAHASGGTSVTTAAFSTAQSGELLVAFLAADGPSVGAQTFSSVTTTGLTWRLRQRANVRSGTAEIWTAVANNVLTNATVRGAHPGAYSASLTVATFTGANTSVDGAVATGNAANGAPTATLTTTRAGSWVWGVGDDWDRAATRTVPTNQTKVDEYLPSSGDTFWTQRQNAPTATAGTDVTINDTAPTTDRWNLSLIEIPPAAPDVSPPSAPTNLNASAVGPNQVNLGWTASADDTGVAGYQIIRGGAQIATATTTAYTDTAVAPSTAYTYTIRAYDAAGNVSADSNPATVTTPANDTTPPVISGLAATNIAQTSATIIWSTDEPATSQVEYGLDTTYGSKTTLDSSKLTSHSQNLGGLTASTTYHLRVDSADVAGNMATSADYAFTTLAPIPDTTPPTVSVTSPANNATVAGVISLSANASDNIGVVGVQFKLDGSALGSELTTSPYTMSWDSASAADGAHTITATARDAAGNTATAANVTVTINNAANNPAVVGQWGSIVTWPEVSIHAALTPTGKVLTLQGDFTQGGQQYLYNPQTNAINQVPNAAADLFCAGQAVTADGRILVIGGTSTSGGLGIRNITAFDPNTETWQNLAQMQNPRWYSTGTTLSDGRILVTSGYNQGSNDLVTIPEIYNVPANSWSSLQGATQSIPVYPFMYQLPDGRVLWAGASETPTITKALDLSTQTWSTVDGRVIDGGSVVNYAPNKFMKAGSAADSGNSGPSAKTAYTLDMSQPNPTWQPTGSMTYARSFLNLTALPDGTVLATGGDTEKSGYNDANGVLPAEVWNPSSGQWRAVASMSEVRLYHSVALLLPDGRVFVSGGGGDSGVADHKSAQIYSPSYLFKGPRPVISSAPSTVQYNSSTFIGTPDASSITSAMLIRTGSVTHAFDQNTRAIPLSVSQASGGLNVQLPASGATAPPGYYMLFIVNGNGVPSVAAMVRFAAPYEDATPPSAPANLAGAGNIGTASLSWTASTDNVGVAGYDIYRSVTPGFTPSDNSKIGATTTTSFTDATVAGTYFYQVRAYDAAGNLSQSSNEVSVTVQADTIPPSAPGNLVATAVNSHEVDLVWTAATDNVAVTRYNVMRDGVLIGATVGLSYNDLSVAASTMYTYTVTAQDATGNVGPASNPRTITTPVTSAAITVDKVVSSHQSAPGASVSVAGMTTTGSNELLVAFITTDGPNAGGGVSFASVSGSGLVWQLKQRANTQPGAAEIWTAVAAAPLTNATITATRSGGSWLGSITVAAFNNAKTTTGAVATANAGTGSPSISLTTTAANSWVWAVGDDWDTATTRTIGPNQTKVDEFLAPSGDTFWVQSQTVPGSPAGALVTMNDTAPTGDRWNLAAVELLAQ
jgi:hypothetical protein